MVVAEKKDSQKIRLCIDPKPLNRALKRSIYPLPTLEVVLTKLAKAKVFSVCDLRNGFWHCKLDEESSLLNTFQYTSWSFKVHKATLRCVASTWIIPEETSRATWRADRNHNDCRGHFGVWPRRDWGRGTHTQWQELGTVTVIAESRGERNQGQRRKFKYRLSEVCYAGHILSNMGVSADPKKTEAICDMPSPEDLAGVRRFLGMANYLGNFPERHGGHLRTPVTTDKTGCTMGMVNMNMQERLTRSRRRLRQHRFWYTSAQRKQ